MFFDKPLQKLDLAQIALLAGLPQAPTEYNPFANPDAARWRRGEVLKAMVQSGYITRAQAQTAEAQGLQVKRTTSISRSGSRTSSTTWSSSWPRSFRSGGSTRAG